MFWARRNYFEQNIKCDSLKLIGTIKTYFKAIENKDLKTIKNNSLNIIDCELCITNNGLDEPIEDAFVKAETFALYLFNFFKNTQSWENLKSGIPHITSTSVSPENNYHPKSVKLKSGEYFTDYEISYQVTGSQNNFYFSFVKVEGKHKLWQIRMSPY